MKPLDKESNFPSPESCAVQVMETVPLVMRVIRNEMRSHRAPDLSIPQFRTLRYVSYNKGASLSEVAEHLGLTLPSMSKLVDKLVVRDLIRRASAPHDRRRITLELTEAGEASMQDAAQFTLARIAEYLAALSAEECATVIQALHILHDTFIADQTESE